jgi:hypothetical protein
LENKNMLNRLLLLLCVITISIALSCKRENTADIVVPGLIVAPPIYSDSVFFIQEAVNYIVLPKIANAGTYTCVPSGLKIDGLTGAIDVNKSETGLKYKVTFAPSDGSQILKSYVIISGINYTDKIYNLSTGDSIARPIYNANSLYNLPGSHAGTTFDVTGGCKNAGIEVDPLSAQINLAKSVRDQRIDTGATQEVKLAYRINDNSHQSLNGLSVKIYFYRTASQIPQYLIDLLNERKATILGDSPIPAKLLLASRSAFPSYLSNGVTLGRPRPPCIIVVAD